MRAWDYHVPSASWARSADAAGGRRRLRRRRRRRPRAPWRSVGRALLLALLALFWLVMPYQESRFLFRARRGGRRARARRRPAARAGRLGGARRRDGGSLLEFPTPERAGASSARPRRRGAPGGGFRPTEPLGRRAPRRRARRAARWARRRACEEARDPRLLGGRRGSPPLGVVPRPRARSASRTRATTWPSRSRARARQPRRLRQRRRRAGRSLHDFGPPGDGHRRARAVPRRRELRHLARQPARHAHQVLFVAALYPIVRRTIAADADGFPIERAWADARPETFKLRFARPAARVYAVELP